MREVPEIRTSRLQRWLLAVVGVLSVALGAIGVFVPGLPTTVFLIAASWCFARSCPWLEKRLIRVSLFRPFLGYVDGAVMPKSAVVISLLAMWIAITSSVALFLTAATPKIALSLVVILAGFIGSWFIFRVREKTVASSAGREIDGSQTLTSSSESS